MYSIEYLKSALIDLEIIGEFIAITLKNPKYARKINKVIKKRISELINSPKKCPPYPFITTNPKYPSPDEYIYRKLVVGYYLVFYVIDKKTRVITIVRIVDGRSDYQNYL